MKKYICIILITLIFWGCSKENPTLVKLVEPANGALLDNNCSLEIEGDAEWFFDWEDFPIYASSYQLYVKHSTAQFPIIDKKGVIDSEYKFSLKGYILTDNAFDWTWKVRARVNGSWTEWSETRYFDVLTQEAVCY